MTTQTPLSITGVREETLERQQLRPTGAEAIPRLAPYPSEAEHRQPGQADIQETPRSWDHEADASPQAITLYVAEEQEIWRQAYASTLGQHPDIRVVDATGDTSGENMAEVVRTVGPDVLLVGVKTLKASTIEKLELVRESCRDVAFVLLFAFYDGEGIAALREFSRDSSVGCAYLLKHTIDKWDQLTQVVQAVAAGRVIVDRLVMEQLIRSQDPTDVALRGLSPKAQEVLGLLAKGYRNDSIAEALSRDVKTVERHINSIYSLFEDTTGSMHPRVQAVLVYLRAKGLLSTEQIIE